MRRTPVALQPASPQAHPQSSEVSRSRSPDCTRIIKDLWLKGQVHGPKPCDMAANDQRTRLSHFNIG